MLAQWWRTAWSGILASPCVESSLDVSVSKWQRRTRSLGLGSTRACIPVTAPCLPPGSVAWDAVLMPFTTHSLNGEGGTENPSLSCLDESPSIAVRVPRPIFPRTKCVEWTCSSWNKWNTALLKSGEFPGGVSEGSCLVLLCSKPFLSACLKTQEECWTDWTRRSREQQIHWMAGPVFRMQRTLCIWNYKLEHQVDDQQGQSWSSLFFLNF